MLQWKSRHSSVLFGLLISLGCGVSHAETENTVTRLQLILPDQTVELDLEASPSLIDTQMQYYWQVGSWKVPVNFTKEQLPPVLPGVSLQSETTRVIHQKKLTDWLIENDLKRVETVPDSGDQNTIITSVEKPLEAAEAAPEVSEITYDVTTDTINFSARPESSYDVEVTLLVDLINYALASGTDSVRVPARQVFTEVLIDPALQARGIKEVVAIGKSNFAGSPSARLHNIKVAMERYNGLILAAGEVFSFNEILKSVDPSYGYKQELVIKGNTTEKEYGGGICQVSSTIYRAALYGGFPIEKRRNHSYAVSYYQPYGLDATIYLGSQDFQFKNDTPGDLLMQTYIEGSELYFVFYGTSDNRTVAVEGPFISGYTKAPAPVYVETDELPPGQKKQVGSSAAGMRSEWVRVIEKPGTSPVREVWPSNYRAWPAKILVGKSPKPIVPAAEPEPTEQKTPTTPPTPAYAPQPSVYDVN